MTEEDHLQLQCAQYCDLMGWPWFHTPNEGKREIRYAAKLKRLGVKAGVPDIMICRAVPHLPPPAATCMIYYNGVAVELKVGKANPTPKQRKWLARLKADGWLVGVCRTFEEFRAFTACIEKGRR